MSMRLDTRDRGDHESNRESQARREAVRRFVYLCSGAATPADWDALRRWREEQPEHERAWQRIEALRNAVRELPAGVASPVLRAQGLRRRAVLKSFVGAAGGLAAGYAAWYALPWARWNATYRTAVGEQIDVRLVDGHIVSMNTGSAMDVRDVDGLTLIRLFAGEVLVTRSANTRTVPLTVCTDDGDVQGKDARFIVRKRRHDTHVAVFGGDVRIHPVRGGVSPLPAGLQITFDERDISSPVVVTEDTLAWRHGSLIVHDWPLVRVLNELGRYRRGYLGCAEGVADLRVSGTFPIGDTDRALAVLTKAFPLRTVFMTPYWVRVEPA